MRSFSFLQRAAVMAVRVRSLEEPASHPWDQNEPCILTMLCHMQSLTTCSYYMQLIHEVVIFALCSSHVSWEEYRSVKMN